MKTIERRTFLKGALKGAAALSAAGSGLLLRGCTTGKEYDILISGGTVYDGTGAPPLRADVGVAGGSVAFVGPTSTARARTVIRADGLAVAPGFIDIHEHTAVELMVNPRAESAIRQGVTTLVSGNCGESPFPLTEAMAEEVRKSLREDHGLDLSWNDARGFFERIEKSGASINYCSYVGQGTVRAAGLGYGNRPATAAEMARMKALVRESMEGGALGLSSGLEYSPGSFASTEELIDLCRVAMASGGVYATHMRDEEEGILEAVDEAIRIARETPVRLQVSHIKIGYEKNWPKFDDLVARIDRANAGGVKLRCDRYPYIAWATSLNMFFPLWAREGPSQDFIARLKDTSLQPRLRAAVAEKEKELGSWDKVLISNVATDKNRRVEGQNVLEASRAAGLTPYEFMRTLLMAEDGRVGMITFAMSEDHLKRLLAHPLVGVGSDGQAVAPYGPLSKGKPHPRFYGTFARVLGKYVREEKVTTLEEMIRKMTSMPAAHLGFLKRGLVRAGWAADLVVFDPARIIDRATWTDPARYPEGIAAVLVNGQVVVERGEHTGRPAGKVLRRNARREVA
jgi:N-acyl-D-amino-acid deacylase